MPCYIQPLIVLPVILDFPLSDIAGEGERTGVVGVTHSEGGSGRFEEPLELGDRELERVGGDLIEVVGERVSLSSVGVVASPAAGGFGGVASLGGDGVASLALIDPAETTSAGLGLPASVFLFKGGLPVGMGELGRSGTSSAGFGLRHRSLSRLVTSSLGSSLIGERTRTLLRSILTLFDFSGVVGCSGTVDFGEGCDSVCFASSSFAAEGGWSARFCKIE